MPTSSMDRAARQRAAAIHSTSDMHRQAFGQHLTPKETALLAVSMLSDATSSMRCLDLGCGTGILSVALLERYGNNVDRIDGVEKDPQLARVFDNELEGYPHRTIVTDALTGTPNCKYERIVLNPPYKKMASNDPQQKGLPVKSANLYTAFLAIALSHLAENGECVAIIPRSWMNGEYFAAFRSWALSAFSLDAMHIYNSRTEIFKETNVLQETMIVRFSRKRQTQLIKVTQSSDRDGALKINHYSAADLISGPTRMIRIKPALSSFSETVASEGFCPSTGKVVDFRSKERIYMTKEEALANTTSEAEIYPLIYAGNFRTGELVHPADIGKCQWYRADTESTKKSLTEPGCYVLVKRFSAKEEARRVTAFPVEFNKPVAFENHTTFIHAGTPRNVIPLSSLELARGLTLWLDTTYIDNWFRDVSGSTQVNAADIKTMPCPDQNYLCDLGRHWKPKLQQTEVDRLAESLICQEIL